MISAHGIVNAAGLTCRTIFGISSRNACGVVAALGLADESKFAVEDESRIHCRGGLSERQLDVGHSEEQSDEESAVCLQPRKSRFPATLEMAIFVGLSGRVKGGWAALRRPIHAI
jgi:hypothetical protein